MNPTDRVKNAVGASASALLPTTGQQPAEHQHVWEKMSAAEAAPLPAGIRCACGRCIVSVSHADCYQIAATAQREAAGDERFRELWEKSLTAPAAPADGALVEDGAALADLAAECGLPVAAVHGTVQNYYDALKRFAAALRSRAAPAAPAVSSVPLAPREEHWGKDCPVGMVQVEFVGCSPKNRTSDYGWKPEKSAFIDVWVDGQRFNIQIGDLTQFGKVGRRGVHINGPLNWEVRKDSLNAVDLMLPAATPTTQSEEGQR